MIAMSGLRDFFRRELLLVEQRRELAATREELAKQRDQNERMRAGMRRCLSCDYRREAIGQDVPAEPAGGADANERPSQEPLAEPGSVRD